MLTQLSKEIATKSLRDEDVNKRACFVAMALSPMIRMDPHPTRLGRRHKASLCEIPLLTLDNGRSWGF